MSLTDTLRLHGEVLLDAPAYLSKFTAENMPWSATVELGVGVESNPGVGTGNEGGKLGPDLCYCFLKFKQNSGDPGQAASFMAQGKKYRLILLEDKEE